MISAMTAILPVDGPELRRTTGTGEDANTVKESATDLVRPRRTVQSWIPARHVNTSEHRIDHPAPVQLIRSHRRHDGDGGWKEKRLTDMS